MFLQQMVNGLTIGSTYALVTIGFTMIYGILELTNFAHSSFYMLGAYLTITFMTMTRATPLAFAAAMTASILISGVLGSLMDRIALKKIRDRKGAPISALLSTVGVQVFINASILVVFGSETKHLPNVLGLPRFNIDGTIVSGIQILIIAISIVLMIGLSLLVYRTKLGSAMRAISQNADAAKLMGIDVNRVISATFFIAIAVAAVAGTLVGTYYQAVDILMATSVGSKSFAAAVLGGMGSLPGAVLGGFLIGIVETLVAGYISSGYRDAIAFAILIFVLIAKPTGLFGQKNIGKV
jgi:branched-chain amino acid transport system permease protein